MTMQTVEKPSDASPLEQAACRQVLCRRQGTAAVLQLNRPERANSYNQDMLVALEREIDACDADPAVRTVVITGAGERSFCAGADRKELSERDWQSVLKLTSARVFRRIRQSRCVTIAAINGAAVAGGLELALACDLRFAVDSARFWLPEPELGLVPAAGGLDLLPRLVGPLRAKEMILGGAQWNADEALRYGLLTEVVPPGQLFERIQPWIDRIALRSPEAVQFSKQAIELASNGQPGTAYDLLAQALLVMQQRSQSEP